MTHYQPQHYAQALFELMADKPEKSHGELANRMIEILKKRGDSAMLPVIIEKLEEYIAGQKERETARIISARPLSGAERKKMKSIVSAGEYRFEEDPKLLGGLVVQKNDEVFYASLRNTLAELHGALTE